MSQFGYVVVSKQGEISFQQELNTERAMNYPQNGVTLADISREDEIESMIDGASAILS